MKKVALIAAAAAAAVLPFTAGASAAPLGDPTKTKLGGSENRAFISSMWIGRFHSKCIGGGLLARRVGAGASATRRPSMQQWLSMDSLRSSTARVVSPEESPVRASFTLGVGIRGWAPCDFVGRHGR